METAEKINKVVNMIDDDKYKTEINCVREKAEKILNEGQESTTMFDNLSEKLQNALKALKGKGKLSEKDIDLAMREVKLSLDRKSVVQGKRVGNSVQLVGRGLMTK